MAGDHYINSAFAELLLLVPMCIAVSPVSERVAYLEVLQTFWYNICPHLLWVDNVTAMLGVPAHGAGAGTFVETAIDLFGSEAETSADAALEERGCRSHLSRWREREIDLGSRGSGEVVPPYLAYFVLDWLGASKDP